ncbi:hypothetical protein C3B61_10795 [Cryobacterium zongtaii]|uniref:Metallo-beta-lactamase domain-containing protein n=2 Tax=Cryobacterium zongtaii TaxID=1259217 RepID=A0A2S3ZEI6_9MICO|nr:hypothetical protein C3B61_10795 [Cryobacterium zongtaii]
MNQDGMTRSRNSVDLRLVLPAMACWLSAGLLVATTTDAALVAGLAAAAAILLTVGALVTGSRARGAGFLVERVRPVLATLAVCCAAAALAGLSVAVQAPVRLPESVRAVAAEHGEASVVLTVWSAPAQSRRSAIGGGVQMRFRATLTSIGEPPGQASTGEASPAGTGLSVPAVVFAPASAETPAIGAGIRMTGTLGATEPGDAAAVLIFGRAPPEPVHPAPWWLAWANAVREGFATASAELPGDGAGLLPGLAIGDTTAVDDSLDQDMKTSSLSHLTAVSGANCAIVLAIVLVAAAALGLGRVWRLVCGLVVLAGFVVLVTPEPSVVRAATMATIVLLSGSLGRPGRGLPALAMASLCLLIFDPWLARNYGFALSVLATLGLLVLAGPLSRRLRRWLPTPVAAVLSIPIAAQLACQPVLVMLSPTLPMYGVPANLLAAPAAPVATVAGLVACLLLPWAPVLATPLVWLAWLPATWIAAVATTTAGMPANSLPWPGGPFGVVLVVACTVAVLTLLAARGSGRVAVLVRTVSGTLVCVVAGWAIGGAVGYELGRAAVFPPAWQIAACDIGQGDAVLVRDGASVALVDVGPDPALLADCLDTLGVDRVDLLVLTHYDLDHIGGLAAVIGRVDTALVGRPETSQDAALLDRLAAGGADVRETARGDTGALGALTWEILWPIRGSTFMQTGNPGSVSMAFDGGGIRSLFLGDLDEEAQKGLMAAGQIAAVDVVKVAHHGSRDQSAALYAEIEASIGVVSVGADNGYGHPTRSVLDILGAAGTTVLRTDRDGMVVVAPGTGAPTARRGLVVWTEKVTGAG